IVSIVLNRQALDVIYKSFVLPCFSYGCVVFSNTTEYNLQRLQSAQYRAALAVTGAMCGSSFESILSDLGWSCIHDMFKQHRIVTYHTIIVRRKPDYLFGLIPTPTHPNSNYNLRSQSATGPQLSMPKCRLDMVKHSFFYRALSEWSSLPTDVLLTLKLPIFKKKIKKFVIVKYPVAEHHMNEIHYCRFQVGFSQLKNDLYKRKLISDPFCSCGAVETSEHFFFHCSLYNIECSLLFDEVLKLLSMASTISMPMLMLRDLQLSHDECNGIYYFVLRYIDAIKRFASSV
ncbi:unnamed protein product, partial [Didymodactylos carnosus]